jgi:hypothetical protein
MRYLFQFEDGMKHPVSKEEIAGAFIRIDSYSRSRAVEWMYSHYPQGGWFDVDEEKLQGEQFSQVTINPLENTRDIFVKATRDGWNIETADVTGQGTHFKLTKESFIMHIDFRMLDGLIIPSIEAYENHGTNRINPPSAYSWGYFAQGHGRRCQVCGKATPNIEYLVYPLCEYCAGREKVL